jgi:hypothetical protein
MIKMKVAQIVGVSKSSKVVIITLSHE